MVGVYLEARLPAAAIGGLAVVGPAYLPIGVAATIIPVATLRPVQRSGLPRWPRSAGFSNRWCPADRTVTAGPSDATAVFLGDVATVLEAVAGVDAVAALDVLVDGTPRGERVAVPPDRLVVAGPLLITLAGEET